MAKLNNNRKLTFKPSENFDDAMSRAMKFQMPKPKFKPKSKVKVAGYEGKVFEVVMNRMYIKDLNFHFKYTLKIEEGTEKITAIEEDIELIN